MLVCWLVVVRVNVGVCMHGWVFGCVDGLVDWREKRFRVWKKVKKHRTKQSRTEQNRIGGLEQQQKHRKNTVHQYHQYLQSQQ